MPKESTVAPRQICSGPFHTPPQTLTLALKSSLGEVHGRVKSRNLVVCPAWQVLIGRGTDFHGIPFRPYLLPTHFTDEHALNPKFS